MSTEPSDAYGYSPLSGDGSREVGRFYPLAGLPGVYHAITTRDGGEFPVEADAGAEACRELADGLGFSRVAWCEQVHGEEVLFADREGNVGRGDALVTDQPDLLLLCRSADCPLILLADEKGLAVGVAHASWRGTVAGIARRAAQALCERFDISPGELIACIGPSAGPDRYEVGPEVYAAAVDRLGPDAKHFFIGTGAFRRFDLWAANTAQLLEVGLDFMNVFTARVCTIEDARYPSYRRDGAGAGRFVAAIGRR